MYNKIRSGINKKIINIFSDFFLTNLKYNLLLINAGLYFNCPFQ